MGLRALIGKIAFFVKTVINSLAQVLIFSSRWPIAVMAFSSRGLRRVDPSRRSRALRPGAVRAAIAIIFIPPIFLVVPTQSFQGLSFLEIMRRHSLYLLEAERKRISISEVLIGKF